MTHSSVACSNPILRGVCPQSLYLIFVVENLILSLCSSKNAIISKYLSLTSSGGQSATTCMVQLGLVCATIELIIVISRSTLLCVGITNSILSIFYLYFIQLLSPNTLSGLPNISFTASYTPTKCGI